MWDSKTYALRCGQNLCTLTIFMGDQLEHISWSKTLRALHMEQCHPPGTCQALAVLAEFPVLLELQDYAAFKGAQLQPNADAAHKVHQKFSASVTVTDVYLWTGLFKVRAVASTWWFCLYGFCEAWLCTIRQGRKDLEEKV